MSKSTILVCGPSPDAVGGGPTHMRNLWASPLVREFRLERFTTGSRGRESPARDEPLVATIVRLVASPFVLAWRILRLGPAIVHLNTSLDTRGFWREVTHLAVAKTLGRRVVYQIHGGSLQRLTRTRGMRAVVRAVLRIPDAVVVLARVEQREFERFGVVRRLAVIPNAVDVRQFSGAVERVHSGQARRLGYLGRLVEGKGLFAAIEAVDALRREPAFAALEFRLAGSGEACRALEAEVSRRGLEGVVRLVGPLSGEARDDFLRETDVMLLPSRSEGLPYSVLESLAAGTPVVASRVGGIPDVVVDGEHGRLIPPDDAGAIADALRDLAASSERLRTMSRACVRHADADLGLDRLAERFGALYRELGAG